MTGAVEGIADPARHLAGQLREQSGWCSRMGSPLYAELLESAAVDAERGGPTFDLLRDDVRPGRGDAVALRLMASVHRLVLTGRAPELAAHYPSAGGGPRRPGAWRAFQRVLAERRAELSEYLPLPCQTNEVGRCAALVAGFLELAGRYRMPLRTLEVGASAGLNLRWDLFHYSGGGSEWGDPNSPVDLAGFWSVPPRWNQARVSVAERRGCDRRPIDALDPAGRLALRASIWADQVERFGRLEGALELAAQVPAPVDEASLDRWLPGRLAAPAPGTTTVVFHSVVEEYLDSDTRARFHRALIEAGERATAEAPLAWLRLEPLPDQRAHGLTLTMWPGAGERLLARCGAHGGGVDCGALDPTR